MYAIYEIDKFNNIELLAMTLNIFEAKIKLNEIAKEFIIKKEGIEKLETVYQEKITDELLDGYYFIKENNKIIIMEKETEINNSGWIFNSLNKIIKKYKIKELKIIKFDKSILPNKSLDENKDNILNIMSGVINSVKSQDFSLKHNNIKYENKEKKYKNKNKLFEAIETKNYKLKNIKNTLF
jgi:hypothetical protein